MHEKDFVGKGNTHQPSFISCTNLASQLRVPRARQQPHWCIELESSSRSADAGWLAGWLVGWSVILSEALCRSP